MIVIILINYVFMLHQQAKIFLHRPIHYRAYVNH